MFYLKVTKKSGWTSMYEMFTKEQVEWLKTSLIAEDGLEEDQIEVGEMANA